MARRLNDPERTLTNRNKYQATLEIENNWSCREMRLRRKPYAYHRSGGDFLNFLILPRLLEWAALSSVPFSKLRKRLSFVIVICNIVICNCNFYQMMCIFKCHVNLNLHVQCYGRIVATYFHGPFAILL